jgi:hypothetical protein
MPAESLSQRQPQADRLWTAKETARFLRCCLRSLDSYRRVGLPSYRIGRKVLFDPAAVKAWLTTQTRGVA